MASPPAFLIISTVSSPPLTFTSEATTFAPSLANFKAVARPIPAAAPVIKAILSLTSLITFSFELAFDTVPTMYFGKVIAVYYLFSPRPNLWARRFWHIDRDFFRKIINAIE